MVLRVLHLSWEYPPDIRGGLGRALGELLPALAQEGVEVTVAAPGDSRMDIPGKVRIVRAPARREGFWAMNVALSRSALEMGPQDLIHAHDWLVAPAALYLSDVTASPLVATFHSTESGKRGRPSGPASAGAMTLEKKLARAARVVTVPSAAMGEEVLQLLGRESETIAHGRPSPAPEPPEGREWAVLFAGRLVPEKGLLHLIRAMGLPSPLPAVLWVAGDGPEKRRAEGLAQELGVRARFFGFLPQKALSALQDRALVAVVPSLYEPFGLASVEAQAHGLPVVASDVGGLAEATGAEAILLPPGDEKALRDALFSLLKDKALRDDLSRRGRIWSGGRTWTETAQELLGIYREVAAR